MTKIESLTTLQCLVRTGYVGAKDGYFACSKKVCLPFVPNDKTEVVIDGLALALNQEYSTSWNVNECLLECYFRDVGEIEVREEIEIVGETVSEAVRWFVDKGWTVGEVYDNDGTEIDK